jgi:hypothetical protein
MTTIQVLFLCIALVLFILASLQLPQPRVALLPLGLAFSVAAMLAPLVT